MNVSAGQVSDRDSFIAEMIEWIAAKKSPDTSYWCWGYSFPWQTRFEVVPAEAPNLVCTTFVALALLDAYDRIGDPKCLEMAVSAAEDIVNDLYWTEGGEVSGFSYPQPWVRSKTHNANLPAVAPCGQVSKYT